MNNLDVVLAIGATTVLLLGVISGCVRNRLWISEPAICLVIGLALSPLELELLGPAGGPAGRISIMQQAARLTLAIAVMGAALRLPKHYFPDHWRELALVLGVGLPLMCLGSSVLAWLLLSVSPLAALLIGGVLSPTDPVLAGSVVAGRTGEANIPARLRHAITAESGANDGLALLLVMLPVLLLTQPPGTALSHWVGEVLLWEVLVALVIGLGLGWASGRALVWAYAQPYAERVSGLTASVSLALAAVACVHLIGASGVLAAFAAGLAFHPFLLRVEDPRTEHVQEAIGRFFDLPVFVLFGLFAPWHDWLRLDWKAFVFAIAVLLLRRPPVWLLLWRLLPSLQNRREALFNGWFGPIGIAALFYAAESARMTGIHEIWTITSLVVFASILVHGISATPLMRRYGRPSAVAPFLRRAFRGARKHF